MPPKRKAPLDATDSNAAAPPAKIDTAVKKAKAAHTLASLQSNARMLATLKDHSKKKEVEDKNKAKKYVYSDEGAVSIFPQSKLSSLHGLSPTYI